MIMSTPPPAYSNTYVGLGHYTSIIRGVEAFFCFISYTLDLLDKLKLVAVSADDLLCTSFASFSP